MSHCLKVMSQRRISCMRYTRVLMKMSFLTLEYWSGSPLYTRYNAGTQGKLTNRQNGNTVIELLSYTVF